jgi:putative transposase
VVAGNSKEAYSSGLAGLADALKNWSEGKRRGRRVNFPRFKKKGRCRESVCFTTGAIRVGGKSHVVLPRRGVRTHEPTRALLERVEAGRARILRATVSREGGRWFVSFTCEVEREPKTPKCPGTVVGVDAGPLHLAVLSTGEKVPNPQPLKAALRKLARLNRELARRKLGSKNREETRRRLARLHARIARIRRDTLHKLTTRLARTCGTIVVETLNVSGMLRNRRLSRSVTDAALAEVRRQLGYKTVWHGSRLVEADRFWPSSRTCSRCGAVKESLPLWERTFRCDACGLSLDRDENAARNLAALVAAVAGSGPETVNARGQVVRPAERQAVLEEAKSRRRASA